MAIYGLGAYYDRDVSDDFVANGVACLGWSDEEARTLHHLLAHVQVGDIFYIKSFTPQAGLTIKAVGLVNETSVAAPSGLGRACVGVNWVWTGTEAIGRVDDKYNVRGITLYEEWNPGIRQRVVGLLLSALERPAAKR